MSSGALRRRALLSGTMLAAAVVGYGRRAYAACVNTGGSTYQCSGAETTTQTISANNAAVSTLAGFSVNAAAGNAITITGDGALSYTDPNASPLTAPGTALYVKSTGDDVGTGTPGSITIDTSGALSGGSNGIYARNYGTGTLIIIANGDVTGTTRGIDAKNSSSGTDLSVTTGMGTAVSGALVLMRATAARVRSPSPPTAMSPAPFFSASSHTIPPPAPLSTRPRAPARRSAASSALLRRTTARAHSPSPPMAMSPAQPVRASTRRTPCLAPIST
jgi:hypothetical protein